MCKKTKGENMDLLLFIGNYTMMALVRFTWHLIRLYVAPEHGFDTLIFM